MKKDLRIAIEEKDEVAIMKLLANGTDLNANIPGEKFAPIHYSAGLHKSTTRLLLDHGADPNIKTIDGLTPLHIAAAWGHQNIIKVLLENGANVASRDNDGNTPLDLARDYKHAGCMRILEHCTSKAKHSLSKKNINSQKNNPVSIGDTKSTHTIHRSHPKMCNLKTTFLMTPENISSRIKITMRDCDIEKTYDESSVQRDTKHYSADYTDVNSRENKRNTRTEYFDSKRTSQGISSFFNNSSIDERIENFNTADNYYSCDEFSDSEHCETLIKKNNNKEKDKISKNQFTDNVSNVSNGKRSFFESQDSSLKVNPSSAINAPRKQSTRSSEQSNTVDIDDSDAFSLDLKHDPNGHDINSSYSRRKWLKRAQRYVQVKVMNCIGQNKYDS